MWEPTGSMQWVRRTSFSCLPPSCVQFVNLPSLEREICNFLLSTVVRARPRVNFLRRADCASKLDRFPRSFGDYMFECGQHAHRVQIIVVTNVRDAEKLSLHLGLSVGYDRAKLVAEAFADGRGIYAGRGSDGSQRGRGRTRHEQLQPKRFDAGARHGRAQLGVCD